MSFALDFILHHSPIQSLNVIYAKWVMSNPRRWRRIMDTDVHRANNLKWKRLFGKPFPYSNPQTLNEKIRYLMAETDTKEWSRCADKYAVREYVEKCGFGDILTRCYGVWDTVDAIEWDKLPDQFVIKCTHDCGSTIIVNDKSKLDIEKAKKDLASHMNYDFAYSTGQSHYLKIKPRIMAEELIPQENEGFQSRSMADYKFWGFNGKVDYCMMVYDRNGSDYILDLYDVKEWKQVQDGLTDHYDHRFKQQVPRPVNLERMVEAAKELSKPFPQVRVDLYNVKGRIYFGELTFTSQGGNMGYYTPEFQLQLGSMVKI